MTHMPRMSGTTADWPDLVDELDRWGEAGRVAVLWWRDDDAATGTPQLASLLRIARGAPIALAVIPARANAELPAALRGAPAVTVLQHGWLHVNRAESGKKSEYPKERPASIVAAEIAAGRARLIDLFGPRALPVFVPPWNRFAPELLPVLVQSGITGLSAMAAKAVPAQAVRLPPGLVSVDARFDVTDWKGGRGFVGPTAAIGTLLGILRASRLEAGASAGAVGILTHHLIMDDATADFLHALGALVARHSAARWTDIAQLLR